MAVTANNVTDEQRKWLQNYEDHTTFDAMHQDELDVGEITFAELARSNISWFIEWSTEAQLAVESFPGKYERGEKDEL